MPDPQPAPPPAPFGVWYRFLRTLLQALAILVAMEVAAPLIGDRPLPKQLLDIARPLGYLPWSISVAAGLNADRLAIIFLTLLLLTFAWPDHLMPYTVPVIAGLLVGTGIRRIILEHLS